MNPLVFAVLSVFFVSSIRTQSTSTPPVSDDTHNEFTWTAFKKVSADYKENFVMSPYSLRRLFSCFQGVKLLSAGAGTNLQQELNSVLNIVPNQQPSGQDHRPYVDQWLRYANAKQLNRTAMAVAIGNEKASPIFDSIINYCVVYTGYLQPSDGQRMGQVVNDALKKITNNSVLNYLADTDINPNWKFFAIDSWQFDGLWKYKSHEEFTATCIFYASKDDKKLTKFLYFEEVFKYGYFPELNIQAVELPYHDKSPLSCLLMMPLNGGVDSLVNSMNQSRFKEVVSKLVPSKTTVRLPQFGLKTTVPGRQLLESMGMKTPFNQGVFKVFEQGQDVALGEIVQKMEINMSGDGEIQGQKFPDKQQDKLFTANQPFMFVIFDRSEVVPVLVGHYLKAPADAAMGLADVQKCDDPPVGYQ